MGTYDKMDFRQYTGKAEIDKALHVLEGILHGIGIDGVVNQAERAAVIRWMDDHKSLRSRAPYSEVFELIDESLEDNVLTQEEAADILWFCQGFRTKNVYYDVITSDIQRLQGMISGILADSKISSDELRGLSAWMDENTAMQGMYPYDELYSLLTGILADGKVDPDEERILKVFFSDFIQVADGVGIPPAELADLRKTITVPGICAVCPTIDFDGRTFCFTGKSNRTTREELEATIADKGGIIRPGVSQKLDYLIVGGGGNPAWAYSCYGRKIETAVNLRKAGAKVVIAHENDLWDGLE